MLGSGDFGPGTLCPRKRLINYQGIDAALSQLLANVVRTVAGLCPMGDKRFGITYIRQLVARAKLIQHPIHEGIFKTALEELLLQLSATVLAPREQLQRLFTNLAIKIRIGIVHKAVGYLGFFYVTCPNPVLTLL